MLQRFLIALALLGISVFVVCNAAEGDAAPEAPASLTEEEQGELDQVIEKVDVIEKVEEPGQEESAEAAEEQLPDFEAIEIPSNVNVQLSSVWDKSPEDLPLLDRLVKGVLRSRAVPVSKGETPKFYWEQGGVEIPESELIQRATLWASTFLASLDVVRKDTGVGLPVWGAFATMANEGGFWECALNFEARKWASEHSCKRLTTETWHGKTVTRKIEQKLVDKFRQTYTCEEVWRIVTDPHFKDARVQVKDRKNGGWKWVGLNNKADGGPWQMRFSMKKMTKARFDKLMSMQPGVYLGAREMARRALAYSYRYRVEDPHPRPWQLWPGWNPNADANLKYDDKITMIARWLGARKDEIERGYVIVDTSRKKPRYRTAPR